jgi:dTDP-4-amino-4,6-dideoxygalactose transaminase
MIPFVDLPAQYRSIKPEIDAAIARVVESGRFVLGPEVEALEREFAAYCGASCAVAVNAGTSALHLALLACGVGSGDEVITVPFTFVATVAAIGYTGARAVLVDVEPRSLTMDATRLERAVSPRTKAIVPVHLYGQPADMAPIVDVARRRGLAVIEDAAQAHGAEYQGRRVGALGDLACFSFYPAKTLGGFGEAGMVTTGNPDYARTVRMLRDWGQERKHAHLLRVFNYRMDALQGAVLRVKLRRLDAWLAARCDLAALYTRLLEGSGLATPGTASGTRHSFHIYAVRSAARDERRQILGASGVETAVHYPVPVHLQPAFADLGYRAGDFPVAEQAAREVLSLPIYPELRPTSVEAVVAALVAPAVHA